MRWLIFLVIWTLYYSPPILEEWQEVVDFIGHFIIPLQFWRGGMRWLNFLDTLLFPSNFGGVALRWLNFLDTLLFPSNFGGVVLRWLIFSSLPIIEKYERKGSKILSNFDQSLQADMSIPDGALEFETM
jgi:hypothetical protein